MTPLYLRFVDKAQALMVAGALSGVPDLQELPPDGFLAGTYYNIAPVFGSGIVYATPPVDVGPDYEPVLRDGYHVNGIWWGPNDTVPPELEAFRVHPIHPACVWG